MAGWVPSPLPSSGSAIDDHEHHPDSATVVPRAVPACDIEYYYTRIVQSDPSAHADRFGLRLSSHAKATALYMLAHNKAYPTTLKVAVQYREGIRRAMGLVFDNDGCRNNNGDGDNDIETQKEVFDKVFGHKLNHLFKYLWTLCRKHGILAADSIAWGLPCRWNADRVMREMNTVQETQQWLENLKTASAMTNTNTSAAAAATAAASHQEMEQLEAGIASLDINQDEDDHTTTIAALLAPPSSQQIPTLSPLSSIHNHVDIGPAPKSTVTLQTPIYMHEDIEPAKTELGSISSPSSSSSSNKTDDSPPCAESPPFRGLQSSMWSWSEQDKK